MATAPPPENKVRGWHPDPLDDSRLRYWGGESWSDDTRPMPEAPEGTPAAEASSSALEKAGSSSPPPVTGSASAQRGAAPHNELAIAAGIAAVGALVLLISSFLPLYESQKFARVADNSGIQQGIGWAWVIFAIGAAAAAFRAYSSGARKWTLVVLGVLAIGSAIYAGTDKDSRTLAPANSTGLSSFLGSDLEEVASPGVGVYAAGVGGLLIVVGGWGIARGRPAPLSAAPETSEQTSSSS